MDFLQIIGGIDWVDIIFTALITNTAVTEALPFMKKRKANGTLDFCVNLLKTAFKAKK